MGAAYPVELTSTVEKSIPLGQNEFSSVLVGLILDIHEAQISHAQDRRQVGVIIHSVTSCSVDLISEDTFSSLLYHSKLENSSFDAVSVTQHLLCKFLAERVIH